MEFGYTIIYVEDVEATLAFYEKAFHMEKAFLHESNQYGELNTGRTKLAFASDAMAASNGVSYLKNHKDKESAGIEIVLVSKDVRKDFTHAIAQGAEAVKEPEEKPWGQLVSYVKDLNGVLIEICSPMGV